MGISRNTGFAGFAASSRVGQGGVSRASRRAVSSRVGGRSEAAMLAVLDDFLEPIREARSDGSRRLGKHTRLAAHRFRDLSELLGVDVDAGQQSRVDMCFLNGMRHNRVNIHSCRVRYSKCNLHPGADAFEGRSKRRLVLGGKVSLAVLDHGLQLNKPGHNGGLNSFGVDTIQGAITTARDSLHSLSDPLLELSEGVAGLLDGGLGDQGARGLNEVGADGTVSFCDLRKTGGNVLFRDLRCLGLHHPLASIESR